MKRILSIAALLLAACASAPAEGTQVTPAFAEVSGEAPIIITHRGASGFYPEHTIKACTAAIEQGADFIEQDLAMTKYGAPIARHDHYLSATTNVADHPATAIEVRGGR